MHPSIARGAVADWSALGDTVVDPFCGSGTVLVEAQAAGRAAIGVDASPLATAIARVRTTLLGDAGRQRLVEEAARIAEEAGDRARRRKRPEVPPWARGEIERFHAHVLFELLGLRELVLRDAGRRRRPRAAPVPVVDPGEVHAQRAPRRRATARPSGSRAAFRRACCRIAPSSWPAGWRRWSGARPPGRRYRA